MMTYSYRCLSCGVGFQVKKKISDPHPEGCPNCDQPDIQRNFQEDVPGVRYKGSGFYTTDKALDEPADGYGGGPDIYDRTFGN